MDLPLPLVAVSGTPRECGVAYGNDGGRVDRRKHRCIPDEVLVTVGHRPARRLAGPATGSAPRRRSGCRASPTCSTASPRARTSRWRTSTRSTRGPNCCTARARRPSARRSACSTPARADGSTLLAQNWDWHPDQRPYTLVLATRDECGLRGRHARRGRHAGQGRAQQRRARRLRQPAHLRPRRPARRRALPRAAARRTGDRRPCTPRSSPPAATRAARASTSCSARRSASTSRARSSTSRSCRATSAGCTRSTA